MKNFLKIIEFIIVILIILNIYILMCWYLWGISIKETAVLSLLSSID